MGVGFRGEGEMLPYIISSYFIRVRIQFFSYSNYTQLIYHNYTPAKPTYNSIFSQVSFITLMHALFIQGIAILRIHANENCIHTNQLTIHINYKTESINTCSYIQLHASFVYILMNYN